MPRKKVTNAQRLPQPKGHFVYCYLRNHSNLPYYIGQGNRPDRVTGKHSCRVPKDRSRIRILREGLDRDGANYWERFYIAHYGCKHDGTGCLMNLRDGGHDGGNLCADSRAAISKKVTELFAQGVFDAINSRDAIERRRMQRVYNLATRLGIDPDEYAAMPKWERDQFKKWRKNNPEGSIDDWRNQLRSAQAAARYGMKQEDWDPLSRKEKNAIKEYCIRYEDQTRTGYDWLAGKRAKMGPERGHSIEQMVEMKARGMSQTAIAEAMGCHQCHVSRSLKKWRAQQAAAA